MEVFAELLKQGEYWVAAAILVLLVAAQLPKMMEFYRNNRNQRCQAITDALNDPNVSSELKLHLANELNIEYFRKVHGTRISIPMLNAAFVLNERVGSKVSFRHVLKTIGLFPDISDIAEISFRVQLSKFDKAFGLFNLVFGLIIATVGFVSFIISLYLLTVTFNVSYLILGLIGIPVGFNMLSDGSALFSVYHVNNALDSYQNEHQEKSL
ncbi:alpha/beta hydrolase family protein [Vibrio metschnikovii]|uniref:hypothetical protein n=1 Tax=Vibrio metschnikovii TaxID=28172 RepID=UPI00164B29EB|nr:hypothetical protein [Vibrio metschnikovii]MBC5833127.1 hypothetical protein [Vibrio metschnikovii]